MFEDRPVEVTSAYLWPVSPPLPDHHDFLPYRFEQPNGSKKYFVSGTTRVGCEKGHYKSPKFEMKWP